MALFCYKEGGNFWIITTWEKKVKHKNCLKFATLCSELTDEANARFVNVIFFLTKCNSDIFSICKMSLILMFCPT